MGFRAEQVAVQSIPPSTPLEGAYDCAWVRDAGTGYIRVAKVSGGPWWYYTVKSAPSLGPEVLACGFTQRKEAGYTIGEAVVVEPVAAPPVWGYLAFQIRVFKTDARRLILEGTSLRTQLVTQASGHLFVSGQQYLFRCDEELYVLACSGGSEGSTGILTALTTLELTVAPACAERLRLHDAPGRHGLFKPDFSFATLGIGGLDRQLKTLFREAFVSRMMPPAEVRRLGATHAKGVLLYGPPGTGKTLIARRIGELLQGHPPQIVNGPEILSKFVGEAERKLRELFAPAEDEQREWGDQSQLHVIIFDELDAVCKSRGTVRDGSGVHDTVVNQLLTKLDGVEPLNNILVIGMTNRPEMIDEALTRQGRLEIKVEVGLPDLEGRLQILKIHTKALEDSGALGPVDLEHLARATPNFSGAELRGVVRSATSHAMQRRVDPGTMLPVGDGAPALEVTMGDLMAGVTGIQPLSGGDPGTRALQRCVPVIEAFPWWETQCAEGARWLAHLQNADPRYPVLSVLVAGGPGTGKSTIAGHLAFGGPFGAVRVVTPGALHQLSEGERKVYLDRAYSEVAAAELGCLVLDDLEGLLEWTPLGSRFSPAVAQTLRVLLKRVPPVGHKLLILATTSERGALEALGLWDLFTVRHLPGPLERRDLEWLERARRLPPCASRWLPELGDSVGRALFALELVRTAGDSPCTEAGLRDTVRLALPSPL